MPKCAVALTVAMPGVSAAEAAKLRRADEADHFLQWTRSVWGEQGEKASAKLLAVWDEEGEDGLAAELACMYHDSGAAGKRKMPQPTYDALDSLTPKAAAAKKPKAAAKPAAKAAKPAAKAPAKVRGKAAKAAPATKRASRRR